MLVLHAMALRNPRNRCNCRIPGISTQSRGLVKGDRSFQGEETVYVARLCMSRTFDSVKLML